MNDQGVRVMQVRQGLRIATPVGLRRARQQVFNLGFHALFVLQNSVLYDLSFRR